MSVCPLIEPVSLRLCVHDLHVEFETDGRVVFRPYPNFGPMFVFICSADPLLLSFFFSFFSIVTVPQSFFRSYRGVSCSITIPYAIPYAYPMYYIPLNLTVFRLHYSEFLVCSQGSLLNVVSDDVTTSSYSNWSIRLVLHT